MTTILKAQVVRIALLGLAVAIIWNTVNYTQDRQMWFLCAFLTSQLVEFLTFTWEVLNSEGNSNAEDKSLKKCLLLFLITACPPICVMEQHRMQEFYMFYGRWDCSTGYWDFPSPVSYTNVGAVERWTCIRTRPIIQCHKFTIINDFTASMKGNWRIDGFTPDRKRTEEYKHTRQYKDWEEFNLKEIDDPEFVKHAELDPDDFRGPANVPKVTLLIPKNVDWKLNSFGNFTFLSCQEGTKGGKVDKALVDDKRRLVRLCYNRTMYWDTERCKEKMDGCRHKNATDPYIQMKLRCRLVELIPFLCATVVSWILTSYDPDYRHLIKLLLRNLFIAADVFELFECFDEPIAYSPHIWTRVLSVWPICMLHLFFVNVMISDGNIPPDQETLSTSVSDSPPPSDPDNPTDIPESASSDPESPPQDTNQNNLFFEYLIANMDMWAAIISGLLHDGLLLYFRINLLSPFDLFEPQIHFFIIKNAVLIVAQVFTAILMCRPPSFNA